LFKPPSLAQVRFFIEKPDVYDVEFTGSESFFWVPIQKSISQIKILFFDWMIVKNSNL
jgi:hypothetical protein